MNRIEKIIPEKASPELKSIYNGIQTQMGSIPNIFQHMGQSPSVLNAFFDLQKRGKELSLSPDIQEKIALITSETNKCNYCLAAHTAIAKHQGISLSAIAAARLAQTPNQKETTILQLAKAIVEKRGHLADHDIEVAKQNGISDKEIVEIIFCVTVTMFTNYFNHVADPEIDFPKI